MMLYIFEVLDQLETSEQMIRRLIQDHMKKRNYSLVMKLAMTASLILLDILYPKLEDNCHNCVRSLLHPNLSTN